jgi:LCP family protein required for cell wall assembly
MVKKFFLLVGSIVGVFILAASTGLYFYMKSTEASIEDIAPVQSAPAPTAGSSSNSVASAPPDEDGPKDETAAVESPAPVDSASWVPVKTNFLIVGEDAGEMLTDVILVGSFDSQTKDINIMSVPRDTYTVIPKDRLAQMRNLGLYPPYDGVMKINAVHSYGGKKYGMIILQQQLEDLLGIDINFYIEVNLKAFREIVDAVGGVDMEIRKRGYYYEDPWQNLSIAVPGGFQHLNGKMAEGVVRYRSDYPGGDLDRINVQQEFLTQLYKQVLNKDKIIQNAYEICKSIISYAKTNFGIGDIPKYIQFIGDMKPENITFHTLPGEAETISKASYFIIDQKELDKVINENFLSSTTRPTESPLQMVSSQSSKSAAIQVLNGAQLAGIASKYQEKLVTDGYNVASIGNYTGQYKPYTRILVKESGLGEDLASYFSDPIISVDANMPERYDIVIIIGRDESI